MCGAVLLPADSINKHTSAAASSQKLPALPIAFAQLVNEQLPVLHWAGATQKFSAWCKEQQQLVSACTASNALGGTCDKITQNPQMAAAHPANRSSGLAFLPGPDFWVREKPPDRKPAQIRTPQCTTYTADKLQARASAVAWKHLGTESCRSRWALQLLQDYAPHQSHHRPYPR